MLMNQEKQNGVTDNFTQYGHNFWGTPSENNYGFGSSNISENIERLKKQFMAPPIQPVVEQPKSSGSLFDTPVGYQSLLSNDENLSSNSMSSMRESRSDSLNSSYPKYWETPEEGEKIYQHVLQKEGSENKGSFFDPTYMGLYSLGVMKTAKLASELWNQKMTDKFKHALINCEVSQLGDGAADAVAAISGLKEGFDILTLKNTVPASQADNYANKIGRLLGKKYPNIDCEELLKQYIKK